MGQHGPTGQLVVYTAVQPSATGDEVDDDGKHQSHDGKHQSPA